jgi:hypothetical protein
MSPHRAHDTLAASEKFLVLYSLGPIDHLDHHHLKWWLCDTTPAIVCQLPVTLAQHPINLDHDVWDLLILVHGEVIQ